MPSLIDDSLPIPKYYQVYQSLHEQIEEGGLKTGAKIPSERALVHIFGVSRVTIVKALDLLEQDHLIERRQGIGNFVIQPATNANETRPRVISLIIPYGLDNYPTKIVVGAAQVATENKLFLQIFFAPQKESTYTFYNNSSRIKTDGIILFARKIELPQFLEDFSKHGEQPVILIDRYLEDCDGDYVIFDDEKAGYQLTKHLIQHGYNRIAFVPGAEVSISSVINRLNGYQRALKEADIPYNENLIFVDYLPLENKFGTERITNTAQCLEEFILQQHPDGMVAANSMLLEVLMHDTILLKNRYLQAILTEKEVAQPIQILDEKSFDIGLAAVSDHWQNIKYDKLHAVAFQDGYDIGAVAMRLMVDRLTSTVKSKQHIILPMPIHIFDTETT